MHSPAQTRSHQEKWSALDCAVYWGHAEVVSIIVRHVRETAVRADSNATSSLFKSARQLASERFSDKDPNDIITLLAQAEPLMDEIVMACPA